MTSSPPLSSLSGPPAHETPGSVLDGEPVAKLKSLTNLRAVPDPKAANGRTIGLDPFPGWKEVRT